jgi:protein-L-isoaspartate(D-aspartate) O-methyltransferase
VEDSYRHQGMRRNLIADLRKRGIQDEYVLAAMSEIPRHFFLDKAFEEWAYQDKPFPIGAGQTISQPYTVAFMTELLEVRKRDKVLEIGTGSGYQAAVLATMGARVFSVERHKALYVAAKALLEKMGLGRIRLFLRDGYKGLPEFAPFDRIIVTAGAPQIPEALKAQLSIGGILVIPVGEDYQTMLKVTRRAEDEYTEEEKGIFRFVPFLGGIE